MNMRTLALSAIVVGGLLSSGAAEADCNIPAWLGTPDNASVPTKGTLYFHDEQLSWHDDPPLQWMKLAWANGEGTVRVVRAEGAPNLARIEYDGPAGAQLLVYDRWDEAQTVTLGNDWQYKHAPRVLQYWHHNSEWTCSSSDVLMIQIDQPTAAVRVRWTVNGHAVDYWEATKNDATKSVLQLGKINCGGENIPLEQLYDGVGIELYAIRFDGTEVKIEGMPSYIALSEIDASERGIDQAFTIVATQEPAAAMNAPAPAKKTQSGRGLGILVMVFAALGVVGCVFLLKRAEKSASDCSPAS
jgi:hypothetical protein